MMLKKRLLIACTAMTTVMLLGTQLAHSHHKASHNPGGGSGNGNGGGNTGNQICHLNPDGTFDQVKATKGHNKHSGDIEPTNGVCTLVIDVDGDGVPADLDCDDNNAAATEVLTYYSDLDSDGFTGSTIESCGLPEMGNYVESPSATLDCDDGNSTVTVGDLYYEDADNDTFTALNAGSITACVASPPYVAIIESSVADCDDNNASITPQSFYLDADGDGYTPSGATATLACSAQIPYLALNTSPIADCDDSNELVNPSAPELFSDNNDVDENCDGVVEYTCPCLHGPLSYLWSNSTDLFYETLDMEIPLAQPLFLTGIPLEDQTTRISIFAYYDENGDGEHTTGLDQRSLWAYREAFDYESVNSVCTGNGTNPFTTTALGTLQPWSIETANNCLVELSELVPELFLMIDQPQGD